ncbi:hypothetical protein BASA60_003218, partial [Batrachochytrium salamandrivorans]
MSDDQPQTQHSGDGGEAEVEEKGHHGQANKDMETVHQYGEDAVDTVDENKLFKALTSISEARRDNALKTHRETGKEVVTVQKEDLEIVMKEFEISKLQADKV